MYSSDVAPMVELESLDAPSWGEFFGGLAGAAVGFGIAAAIVT